MALMFVSIKNSTKSSDENPVLYYSSEGAS
jgi:hypothetical protein